MNNVKKIAYVGIGIALYVVMSFLLNIPLVGHMRLDCGYIVYAVYLALFNWLGIPVGVIGCFIKGYVSDGWIPYTWMLGQIIIGVICVLVFKRTEKKVFRTIAIVFSVFLGIGLVSSVVSALMFNLPIGIKIAKGCIGAAADSIAMIIGIFIVPRIKKAIKEV